jgi:hypothetical protein
MQKPARKTAVWGTREKTRTLKNRRVRHPGQEYFIQMWLKRSGAPSFEV